MLTINARVKSRFIIDNTDIVNNRTGGFIP